MIGVKAKGRFVSLAFHGSLSPRLIGLFLCLLFYTSDQAANVLTVKGILRMLAFPMSQRRVNAEIKAWALSVLIPVMRGDGLSAADS